MKRTVMVMLAAAFAVITALVTANPPAYAGTGNQICTIGYAYCPNAWNGGPWIKSYSYSAANNDFTWVVNVNECNGGITTSTCPGHGIAAGQGIGGLEFTGGGSWNGQCMADAYNNSGDARDALNSGCPGGSNGNGAWGSNFVWVTQNTCGGGPVILYDIHWDGYIYVPENNGTQLYLNNANGSCMKVLPPA